MSPYPMELRRRIVEAYDQGLGSVAEVAERFQVSSNWVVGYLDLREQTGSLKPRPNAGGNPPAIPPRTPPRTACDAVRAAGPHPRPDSPPPRHRLLVGGGQSHPRGPRLDSKKKNLHAAEQQRPDVQQARDDWADWQTTLTALDLERLVFWDERAVITAMTPTYGRSRPGERIVEYVPHGDGERWTLTAAIRWDGVCTSLVFAGGATVEACEAFTGECLGPVLRLGDVVIMDRLSAHQHADVIAAIERRRAVVKLLPAYWPDFNPIENAFSKLKTALRQARARNVEDLIRAIGDALNAITAEDIQGWFAHCGYHTDP